MATTRKRPSTIAQAKKAKSKFFYGKGNKKLAAVTKEDMEKAGFKSFGRQSLRKYLENQQNKPKQTAAKVAPRPRPRPAPKVRVPAPTPRVPAPTPRVPAPASKAKESEPKGDLSPSSQARKKSFPELATPTPKRKTPASLKASSNADLSAPEIPKSKTPQDILGTREQSRARRKARQKAKTEKDTSMTPEQKLKGQIGIGAAAAALIAPVALPILMKVATKHGPAFARSLGNKIKNLTSGQQKNVAQAANKAPTKTAAQKETSAILKSGGRTQGSGRPLAKDRVEPYKAKAGKPLTKGQSSASRTMDAARQNQRTEIDVGYTGGALKRGGQIKKYNKGGKVVKRKEGGQVMSGNDLVSSLYN